MTELRNRILIVDDDESITAGLAALLSSDWDARVASNGREAIVAFADFSPDVVLLDVGLPDTTGIDLLHQLKAYSESTPIIMMSGAGTMEAVIESMKLGAETFLQKPFEYDLLVATIEQVKRAIAQRKELLALRRTEEGALDRLPGASPAIAYLNQILPQIARSPSAVLIEGESGTGKGVLARLIHERSARASKPFVDLNCAGLSKELLESELFGHERGAFTNANTTKSGLFEIAGEGTLFLDEIGEMEPTVQARLLKAIEDKRFRRVGGTRDIRADFRLIAATNRDLAAEVAAGNFRSDLYYRLNVVRLRVPPLRERLEDVPILIEAMLPRLAKDLGRTPPKVSVRAMEKLQSFAWPGNIRELRNVLERALLTLAGDEIRNEDLRIEPAAAPVASSNSSSAAPWQEWQIEPLDTVVARYVAGAVEAAGGNVRKAARQLQISPSTLYARLKDARGGGGTVPTAPAPASTRRT
jgi:DNA-binding NtrC family response regulator